MAYRSVESKSLSVLGGSSVATPILLEAIRMAQALGDLPSMHVRLWGRSMARMEAIASYTGYRLKNLSNNDINKRDLTISTSTDLAETLYGTDLVLCQVRPGGMSQRAEDERLALRFNIPGDEGLGPSGLACFLRSRPVILDLARASAKIAPHAVLLIMTSPLGLNVALGRGVNKSCYGVCELPATTIAKVRAVVEPIIGAGPLDVLHFGLNHQGWLHSFRDVCGIDRTDEVLNALDDDELVMVDTKIVSKEGAIPLPYLSLYYHTQREIQRQRQRVARGDVLEHWAARAHAAYVQAEHPDYRTLDAILGERHVDWYGQGVVPALSALLGEDDRQISLNLPDEPSGDYPGCIVERQCSVSRASVAPIRTSQLPSGPKKLLEQLVSYEQAALRLSDNPDYASLASVLSLHPLVESETLAERIAAAIRQQRVADDRSGSTGMDTTSISNYSSST